MIYEHTLDCTYLLFSASIRDISSKHNFYFQCEYNNDRGGLFINEATFHIRDQRPSLFISHSNDDACKIKNCRMQIELNEPRVERGHHMCDELQKFRYHCLRISRLPRAASLYCSSIVR